MCHFLKFLNFIHFQTREKLCYWGNNSLTFLESDFGGKQEKINKKALIWNKKQKRSKKKKNEEKSRRFLVIFFLHVGSIFLSFPSQNIRLLFILLDVFFLEKSLKMPARCSPTGGRKCHRVQFQVFAIPTQHKIDNRRAGFSYFDGQKKKLKWT